MPTKKSPSQKKPRAAKRKRTTKSSPPAPTSKKSASADADMSALEAQTRPPQSAPSASPQPVAQDTTAEGAQPGQGETAQSDPHSDQEHGHLARSQLKALAAWYINSSEQIALKALTLQQHTAAQTQDTPWGPFFEFQYSLTSRWVENTVSLARAFWKLGEERESV